MRILSSWLCSRCRPTITTITKGIKLTCGDESHALTGGFALKCSGGEGARVSIGPRWTPAQGGCYTFSASQRVRYPLMKRSCSPTFPTSGGALSAPPLYLEARAERDHGDTYSPFLKSRLSVWPGSVSSLRSAGTQVGQL